MFTMCVLRFKHWHTLAMISLVTVPIVLICQGYYHHFLVGWWCLGLSNRGTTNKTKHVSDTRLNEVVIEDKRVSSSRGYDWHSHDNPKKAGELSPSSPYNHGIIVDTSLVRWAELVLGTLILIDHRENTAEWHFWTAAILICSFGGCSLGVLTHSHVKNPPSRFWLMTHPHINSQLAPWKSHRGHRGSGRDPARDHHPYYWVGSSSNKILHGHQTLTIVCLPKINHDSSPLAVINHGKSHHLTISNLQWMLTMITMVTQVIITS